MPFDRLWDHHNIENSSFILHNVLVASEQFYQDNKGNREIEHHVGRYLNMKKIVDEIISNNISGDVVEFGTYQGLGLLKLAQCFGNDPTPRKFLGLDSFQGLPIDSNGWLKGTFGDTSYDAALANVTDLWPANPNLSFELIPGWFNEPHVAETVYDRCLSLSLVHYDADLGVSTTEALAITEHYLTNRTEPMFFLFDDWGIHPEEVPVAWNTWLNTAQEKFNLTAEEISSTVWTKNFRITFN
jgi:hypothetical protein